MSSMEGQQHDGYSTSKKQGRVLYDNPSASPKESLHWKRLHEGVNPHTSDGANNNIIRSPRTDVSALFIILIARRAFR